MVIIYLIKSFHSWQIHRQRLVGHCIASTQRFTKDKTVPKQTDTLTLTYMNSNRLSVTDTLAQVGNLLEAVSCSSRNTFNNWTWMSSSSLPGERTLRHTMNKIVSQQLCYFVGHACGIPPLGAAPDLEYFANIVERYATIR